MNDHLQKIVPALLGIASLIVVSAAAGCARHALEIDVTGTDGYSHHGYYDDRHDWHGGWYDHDRHFHEDPRDWRR